MATAITMHNKMHNKRHSPVSSKKKKLKHKHPKKSLLNCITKKEEFSKLIKEINNMPSDINKCYAHATLPNINWKTTDINDLVTFFQKYFGDDIDDIYIPNWIRIGIFTTNNRTIASEFINLCNTNSIQCYGRNIRGYFTKYNRKFLVHILNINWCMNDNKFNKWIHESFLNNQKNKSKDYTFESMKINNIESFCSPLNPSQIDKKVIIKLNNEITRDWLLKNEDIKFKNWPFYFNEWCIINDESANANQTENEPISISIPIPIEPSNSIPAIQQLQQPLQQPMGTATMPMLLNYNYAWSVDDVERLLLNTKLAEQEQLINNLIVQNKLLNDQYLKQKQLLNALQTQNHSVIFDEFMTQKNMNIRLNIKYNELFAKYAKINNDFDKLNELNVLQWSTEDVVCWILGLENGRFLKHKHAIIPNIINQNINGKSLIKLKLIDISRIGITSYWDQEWLMHGIKKLIKKSTISTTTK